jgi:hypothetical protein
VRYEAKQGNRGTAWWWSVRCGDTELCPPPLTEAEAKIIAWALEAVAEGNVLFKAFPNSGVEIYPGPVAGVAPREAVKR